MDWFTMLPNVLFSSHGHPVNLQAHKHVYCKLTQPEHHTPPPCPHNKAGSLPPTSELYHNHVPHPQTVRTMGGALWLIMYEEHSSCYPAQALRRVMMYDRRVHLGRAVVKKDYKFPPANTFFTAEAVFLEYQLGKYFKSSNPLCPGC